VSRVELADAVGVVEELLTDAAYECVQWEAAGVSDDDEAEFARAHADTVMACNALLALGCSEVYVNEARTFAFRQAERRVHGD
jgi:hypothetical protein